MYIMCIIMIKEKGFDLFDKEKLESAWDFNGDGGGFSRVIGNKVVTEKGFMNFDTFYDRLVEVYEKENLKEKNLLVHLRIGTSGIKANPQNTHPFPLTKNFNMLTSLDSVSDIAIAHNGILSAWESKDKNSIYSDTQYFIANFIYPIYKTNKRFYEDRVLMNKINMELGASKLAFLTNEDKIITLGEYIVEDGYMYSNDSYDYGFIKEYKKSPNSLSEDLAWELNFLNKYDMPFSYSNYVKYKFNKELTIHEFLEVIDSNNNLVEIYGDGDLIVTDSGDTIIANYNYCIDEVGEVIFIDWNNFNLVPLKVFATDIIKSENKSLS